MNFKPKDHYFKKAKKENYLARSVYKLEEIDKRFGIIKKNDRIFDLGCCPGSWVQYCSQKTGESGFVTGIDLMDCHEKTNRFANVRVLKKDIFNVTSLEDLEENIPFDVVLSDMAPRTTGIKTVDQSRSLELIETVFDRLSFLLKKKGHLVAKFFESHDMQVFLKKEKKAI